jgi:hypothetical protein
MISCAIIVILLACLTITTNSYLFLRYTSHRTRNHAAAAAAAATWPSIRYSHNLTNLDICMQIAELI